MKTIYVDARMYLASGIGTYLRNLVKVIAEYKVYALHLITTPEVLYKAPELNNFDLSLINAEIYSIKEQIALPLAIKNCDLFWTPNFNIPLLPIRAKKRVVTIHDIFYLVHSDSLPLHKKYYAKVVTQKAAKTSDLVITDSDFSKEEICKYTGISGEKVRRIHLGVDTSAFAHKISDEEDQKIRKKYTPATKFFLYVGNVKPHKNIHRLLEAYRLWLEKNDGEIQLVIIGKHFPDYMVKKHVEENSIFKGKVHFYTSIENEELKWFYSNAQCLILPSLYEGFGFPPLEAMCCNCPTLVSDVASLPEICGDASCYVNPTSVESILEGMQKMIADENLRKSLIERGSQRVKKFLWKDAAEKHLQVFNELINSK